jgi:hypothetical protein
MKTYFFKPLIIFLCWPLVTLSAADQYEPDNVKEQANLIFHTNINETQDLPEDTVQIHDFTDSSDVDWVKFDVNKKVRHKLEAAPQSSSLCDPGIEIYYPDGQLLEIKDESPEGETESIEWTPSITGKYFARVFQCTENGCTPQYGQQNSYALVLSRTDAGSAFGYITGKISPCNHGINTLTTQIWVTDDQSFYADATLLPECYFFMSNEAGSFQLNIKIEGYLLDSIKINVPEMGMVNHDAVLTKILDYNGNFILDIGDVIQLMQQVSQ